MALTIATGFVVDDAIVVLENTSRHIEKAGPAVRGRRAGRGGSRLYGAVHEPVADCRVHSDPVDGRHRRAVVPRVRGHPLRRRAGLAGRVADHHADALRTLAGREKPTTRPACIGWWNSLFDRLLRGYERELAPGLALTRG